MRNSLFDWSEFSAEKALEILERNGTQLSPEDVTDFFQLALYYAKNTPESVRRSFHHLIFGINFDEESNSVRLKELLCLPILGIDLTSKEEISSGAVNFFIIDTRSDSDFDSGHYVSSFNLDCGAMVDEPEKFAIALNSLENYKASRRPEDHYTILGYGTDEQDKYTNMLVAMLVQKSKAHVSFIEGGFKLMHDSIARSNRWELISMHSEVSCKLCNKEKVTPKWSLISKVKSAMSSTSSRMKERVEAVVFPIENETPEKSVTHVSSEQRHEKRYRQQSVFTIDEHSDDDSESAAVDENLKEEILLSKEFTETFECKEIFRDQNINGHIALTRTHLYVLHDVLDKKGYVTTKARHALSTIVAVTSRKSVPELLTFKLGYEMNGLAKITAVHKLYVPKAGECAKAVKLAIYALRPYTGPDN
uniref:Rhodanese domain-containing protein n=1 Tax=Caenorhabditis japonica TaxID=281687 RepID=A0A8R1DP13_CAEJA